MPQIDPHLSQTLRRQWMLLIGALVLIGGIVAFSLHRQHEAVEVLEKERLSLQAKVVDENLGHQLIGVSQALEGIQNDIEFWSERPKLDSASRHLQTLSASMPGVRTFLVLNADGIAVTSDRLELIGKDFSHRDYFKVAKAAANPAVTHVLPPFETSLKVYAIVLARSVFDASGKFAGVVTATLDPAYFSILLGSVRYAPDMRVAMNHADGLVFLAVPPSKNRVHQNLAKPGTFYTQHVESGRESSLFMGRVFANGENRMMALRTISPAGLPLDKTMMVSVSRDLSAIFETWRHEAYLHGALFVLLAAGMAAGLHLRQRQERAYHSLVARQEEERSARERKLRDSERFLGTLVDVVPGMAGYWGTDLRCHFANREFREFFGRAAEEMPGIQMRDLLGEETFKGAEPHVLAVLNGQPQHFERTSQRPDGSQWHGWVHYFPDIDQGQMRGFFVLVTDITELKQAQFQLERLNEDLKQRTSQAEAALADYLRADTELQILATAFESQQGIMITDADGAILRVNRAFTSSTGYSTEELAGKNPRVLQSGRHDSAFFKAMWERITECGSWQGEMWDRRKNGDVYPAWVTITAVKGASGAVSHYVSTHVDITSRKQAEEEIRHLAFYDPLTRLPNRRLLLERLRQAQANRARTGRDGALMFIDLDNFKTLNDTLGHDKGDLLLEQVAQRLPACVRETDTVARLGGDEFVVMLEGLSTELADAAVQADAIGQKILEALNQPYQLAGHAYHSAASIGVAMFKDSGHSIEELMKRADMAMYQAKAAGRNTLRFFDPMMQAQVAAHAALETELRHGLAQQQFVLYYQAQVDVEGAVTGAEVLVRWRHPARGMVSPADFIPAAEKFGLIVPLGHWVLEQACGQLVRWAGQPRTRHLSIAVNISARQFYQADFVEQVLGILEQTGADPHKLKLELTESLMFEDVEDIIAKMSTLKEAGVGFSLDDFGIGYSSLSYLKRLPLDQLKIDQSFVRDVLTDANDAAIAKTIVALGQSLGLAVIAEGVETEAQRSFLAENHCFAYQGYLFSPPVPLEKFEQLLD